MFHGIGDQVAEAAESKPQSQVGAAMVVGAAGAVGPARKPAVGAKAEVEAQSHCTKAVRGICAQFC